MAYNKTETILAEIEARKLKIIAAALDIIGKHGMEGVVTSAVAERAKVSQGLIFKYFADKTELVAAVIGFVLARDLAILRDTTDLDEGIRAWARQCSGLPRTAQVIGATPEYRNGIRGELTKRIRAAGIENSPLMGAVVYGAVLEACSTLKPRDELLLVSTLMKAMGVRVRA